MTPELALQLIMVVTTYCSGPGMYYDKNKYYINTRTCFSQIWDCGHNTKVASVIPFETHNCITKHLNGELK